MNSAILDQLETDLEDYATVPFQAMLKGLIAKLRIIESTPSKSHKPSHGSHFKGLRKPSEQTLTSLVKSAVDFCNGKVSQQLKQSLQEG